ncbi:MAG: hypothetical protein ACOCVI_01830 [Planctomycetota bacterium]
MDDDTTIALKDAEEARADMERLACDIIQSEGPKTVSDLVKRVADEMYHEELRNGAWAVDIGIWGPSLFNRDAMALLDGMKDRCLAVVGDKDK